MLEAKQLALKTLRFLPVAGVPQLELACLAGDAEPLRVGRKDGPHGLRAPQEHGGFRVSACIPDVNLVIPAGGAEPTRILREVDRGGALGQGERLHELLGGQLVDVDHADRSPTSVADGQQLAIRGIVEIADLQLFRRQAFRRGGVFGRLTAEAAEVL